MSGQLKGRVAALVTGSTSGIGRAIARSASRAKARTLVVNGFGDAAEIEALRANARDGASA